MPAVDVKGTVIDFPDSMTPEQLQAAVSSAASQIPDSASQAPLTPLQQLKQMGTDVMSKPGIVPKIWEGLTVPKKAAEVVLPQLTKLQSNIQNKVAQKTGLPIGDEPTGNLTRDLIAGTPKIIGQMGEAAVPDFVSRWSILTAGALKGAQEAAPLIKMMARGGGAQLESLSGTMPGALEAAYKAPILKPLQFQRGKKAASAVYEAGKDIGGEIRPELAKISKPLRFVNKAAALAEEGKLNPTEALEARKELAGIKKTVTGTFFRETTEKLNNLAKPVFAEADAAHRQGLMADSLRQLVPQNKYGGASAFKTAIMTGIQAMKQHGGTAGKVAGTVAQLAMSPAVGGVAATVAGDVAKVASPLVRNPVAGAALKTTVQSVKEITKTLKGFYKEITKNNPELSDEEVKDRVRARAKKEGIPVSRP